MNISVKGNVGQDPEFKVSKSGTQVCSFSLAYTPRKKQGSEWIDGETMWFRVVQFGEKAEQLADQVAKGDPVIVVGSLSQSTYQAKDGSEKTSLEITATDVGVLPKRTQSNLSSRKEDAPW